MDWTMADYAAAATLLAGLVFGAALALRMRAGPGYRAAAIVTLVSLVALIWVNGAVGFIGASDDPANLMYGAVVLAALAGAGISRLRAAGMAVTLAAMAGLQLAIGVVAVTARLGSDAPSWPQAIIGATVVFTGLFLVAAALFRGASRAQPAP